jgi:hypothetical protein
MYLLKHCIPRQVKWNDVALIPQKSTGPGRVHKNMGGETH